MGRTIADCVEGLAIDPAYADRPAARQATDGRTVTYRELDERVKFFARKLIGRFPDTDGKRPICLYMDRDIDWYVCYLACARAGIPVVGASIDLPDKQVEQKRFEDILRLLNPIGVIVGGGLDVPDVGIPVTTMSEITLVKDGIKPASSESEVLSYQFTGGTTAQSKCVLIPHKMSIFEIENYKKILPRNARIPESVLQNSSMYWTASAFGQLDIAIAFGACAVLSVVGGGSAEEVNRLVEKFSVECIGVVPSVLRALDPDACASLSLVFTWGESLPKAVAYDWCNRMDLIDLLIATEYWLSFFSVISGGTEWSYQSVVGADIHLERLEDREVVWIAGDMVTSGYVNGGENRFKKINGKVFFCTNDAVTHVERSDDGTVKFRYAGRIDDLQKIGGKFIDLAQAGRDIAELIGSKIVEDCLILRDTGNNVHAIFVLKKTLGVGKLLAGTQKIIPAVKPGDVHVLPQLPRNIATNKIDTRLLVDMLSNPMFRDPQYRLPDAEIPPKKLLAVPNPHRFVWLIVVVLIASLDIWRLIGAMVEVFLSSWRLDGVAVLLLRLPFITGGLEVMSDSTRGGTDTIRKTQKRLKSLFYEFPGDLPWLAVGMLVLVGSDGGVLSPFVRFITLVGDVAVIRPDLSLDGIARQAAIMASIASSLALSFSGNMGLIFACIGGFLIPYYMVSNKVHAIIVSGMFEVILGLLAAAEFTQIHHFTTIATVILAGQAEGLKNFLSYTLVFYVTAPSDLGWAWTAWWRGVPSYLSVFLYYGKKLKRFEIIRKMGNWLDDCWEPTTASPYRAFPSNTSLSYKYFERSFQCEGCKQWAGESDGAYDRYKKFNQGVRKWYCETCWWSQDTAGCPRIGIWSNNWVFGKLRNCMQNSRKKYFEESEEEVSTRTPSISDLDEVGLSGSALICLQALHAVGIEVNEETGFQGMSSLLQVAVHEQLKKRMISVGNVSAVALFRNVNSFDDLVQAVKIAAKKEGNYCEKEAEKLSSKSRDHGFYKIPVVGKSMWEFGACDWLLKLENETEISDSEFDSCFKALVKRHPALRAYPLDHLGTVDHLQQAICLSPDWLKPSVLKASEQLWPRIVVKPFLESMEVPIQFHNVEGNFHHSVIVQLATKFRRESVFKPPFDVVVFRSTGSQKSKHTYYVYFRLTHLFADGFGVNTIAGDIDAFFKNELGDAVMNGFHVLEQRLFRGGEINLSCQAEDTCRDKSLVQVMWLQHQTVKGLLECASVLGVPMDVLMMGLVLGSLANKLGWKKLPLQLMHAQRDGTDEAKMLGFFSDYKDMGFLNMDCSYIDLFHQLTVRVRNRAWRVHDNTLYDHSVGRHASDESMFPVSVNLLPRFRKTRDMSVENVETYWRAGPRQGQTDARMIHVYMEETKVDKEWAVRLHLSKRLFNCTWVIDYVCRVFENAVMAVLSDPTRPIVT